MAKGLGKKGGSSKKQKRGQDKAVLKAKKKAVQDLTFGLKNKKSKKAQKYIKQMNSHLAQSNKEAEARRLEKLAQRQREKELNKLFGLPKKRMAEQEEEERRRQEEESAQDILNDIDEEIEMENEMTLEDVIEKERSNIMDGTPVTLESFLQWKKFKDEQKAKEEETLANLRKKAFSKTGSGLSGKELFEHNSDVFKDAAGAAGKEEYVIDEDLFLDDEDEEEEEADTPFDAKTWEGDSKPKQLLQEYVSRKLKLPQNQWPKYQNIDAPSSASSGGKFMKVVLPHLDNKEFMSPISYTKKKDAENSAALVAFRYLQKNFIDEE
mmetsp:Transcript_12322/g.18403  ORF Transcript_12322/g.18403 Transcript_12322/m.18403 type:complete len:323 (+) Transcript_12322:99-1067(+)